MSIFRLVDISGVEETWQTAHQVHALEIDGECDVNMKLDTWKRSSRVDHDKILNSLEMLCENRRIITNTRRIDCDGHPGLLELKAPRSKSRIFFFYYQPVEPADECAVCVSGYWKKDGETKKKDKLQDDAMAEAERRMTLFVESGMK